MSKKHWLAIAVVVLLAIFGVFRLVDGNQTTQVEQTPQQTEQPNQPQPTTPELKTPPLPADQQDVLQAVTAAATAIDRLAQAQFEPSESQAKVVSQLVEPSQQAIVQAATANAGRLIASTYGYPSVEAAQPSIDYYVSTNRYRVERFDGQLAVVSLFTITHWVAANSTDVYQTPAIEIVHMRLFPDGWRFAHSEDPPAGDAPPLRVGLDVESTVAEYQPYLERRGFSVYRSTQNVG